MDLLNINKKDLYNILERFDHLTWGVKPLRNCEVSTNETTGEILQPESLIKLA